MNILYITLSEPRLSERGIYPDLVRALRRASHEITIVYAASPARYKKTELIRENGVNILRVVVGENFNVGLIKKGINTLKLEPLLKLAIGRFLKDKSFDLCIYATPPVTFAGVVDYCRKKFGVRTFLMLKDIFPQNAVDIGLFKKGSPVYRVFKSKERRLYALSDAIGCMSEGNLRYLKEHEPWLEDKRLSVFPNTIEIREPENGALAKRQPKEAVSFVFGGNLGKPQAVEWLISAIGDRRLKERRDIVFYMIGTGSEKEKAAKAAKELPNLIYREALPPDEYERLMAGMDVGIISLDHRFTIPNYPSRILSYMNEKKPVLACTDEVTDIKELVVEKARCGLWVSSDDRDGFVKAVSTLAENAGLRREMGERGFEYLKENFDVELSVRLLERMINV
ncbi:MAG TPA: glycosyltransferase WbuB [Lachnospiraceae bacterium]|nr:glycosyltransferase WbuB [Lachnospiraceae bacterium]